MRLIKTSLNLFMILQLFYGINAFPTTTEKSIVVVTAETESENVSTEKVSKSESTTIVNNVTVDHSSTLKPKITSMHVKTNVTLRYANTLITSRVINPATKANEVTFSVVLPETAFISGFSMEIDGKVYDAYVKEKEEAKRVYENAVSSGQAAAHVAVQARDSNQFTVSVNIEPESKAIFRLRYEELLIKRLGLYNLVLNLNPGEIVDKLSVDVDIMESSPISMVLVPELRTGNEIDALPTDAVNPYSTKTISEDKLHASVHFSPNKEQQLQLMKVFKEKQIKLTTPSPYPYHVFEPMNEEVKGEEGISGQFVVQYDVDIDISGQILVNDGYFVHFFAPKNLKPLRKHVIFVLDVSGSMIGRKINQLKEAMMSILEDLNPGDYFNIIDFNYNAKVYSLEDDAKHVTYKSSSYNYFYDEQEEQTQSSETIPPKAKLATPENIKKAKDIIKQLNANGGTNINDALSIALKVANYGIEAQKSANNDSSTKQLRQTPMIIFLTDGDPTVGETNPDKIIATLKTLNNERTALFSLAFGEDADRNFLRKLSLQNYGFMRHIYEAADAVQQLQHFYRQVSSPLLADIKYIYPKEQIEEASLTKYTFDHYFLGSEIVVAGKLRNTEPLGTQIKVIGQSEGGPIDYIPIVIQNEKRTTFWPMERLWAYLAIKQLIDDKDSKSGDELKNISKKALDLALKYSFVTSLTSLVVVKPNTTSSAVNAESLQATSQGGAYPLASYALPLVAGGLLAPQSVSNRVSYDSFSYGGGASWGPQINSFAIAAYPDPLPGPPGAPPPQMDLSYALSEDDTDYSYESAPAIDVNRPLIPTPKPPLAPKTTTYRYRPTTVEITEKVDMDVTTETVTAISKADDLTKYALEKYTWIEQYLSSEEDSLTLPLNINGTQSSISLKLLSESFKNETIGGASCKNGVNGGEGVCQYLTNCASLEKGFTSLIVYNNYYCDADGYAGICCDQSSR